MNVQSMVARKPNDGNPTIASSLDTEPFANGCFESGRLFDRDFVRLSTDSKY